jgi:uncharacterized protein YbjT (DUF2867 family)
MRDDSLTIAVAGGTGTLGRRVAEELRSRGHDVRVLSRRSPDYRVDLTTGTGLAAAVAGCDVTVDASNDTSKHAAHTLVEGSRRLLAAGQAAGVRHHVCVSIVGCDRAPVGYFRAKLEQERAVERGPVPWSLVRATQFHELVAAMLAPAARWRVLPVPRAALQPVACAEVARAVADVAEGPPRLGRLEVAGPEVADARDLARIWRSVTRRRAILLPVPLPGKLGRALRAGALTAGRPDVSGTIRFAAWLESAQREAALHDAAREDARPEAARR